MRARLLCVCAWLAWGCAVALHGATLRPDTSHRRFKRYLIFPEGSSIAVSVVWATNYDLRIPGVWDITGEIVAAYDLPDHYIKKKFYLKHEPTTIAPAVHHHHSDFAIDPLHDHDFHYRFKHHKFHKPSTHIYLDQPEGNNFDYRYFEHETPHFAEHFEANPKKRKQRSRHRYQRHLWERKNWQNQLQALLKEQGFDPTACLTRARCEARNLMVPKASFVHLLLQLFFTMPHTEESNEETPIMCKVAKESCSISFLDLEIEGQN